MNAVIKQSIVLDKFGILWLAPWVALQGIPGTGFIRSVFLFAGVMHLLWTLKHYNPTHAIKRPAPEAWLLASITLWLVIQSTFFSISTPYSLKELADHFGTIILLIFIAIAFCKRRHETDFSWLLNGVFLGFFAHVISTLSFQCWNYFSTGHPAIGDSFMGNYGYVSTYVTGSLAFLLADVVSRRTYSRPLLNVSTWLVIVAIFLTLIAQAMLAAKASTVMAIVLVAIAGTALILKAPHSRVRLAGGIALLFIAIIFSANIFSNRWQSASTLTLSTLQKADVVSAFTGNFTGDASFYQRYAWGKAGLEGIAHRPLGYGYGSEGYGKYISDTYNISGVVSSHSGWIDFTLDNGIPGMVLLLALSALIAYRGWRVFLQGQPIGLALTLFVVNYMGRCAIDGHLVGSRLTGFAFAAAILWALAVTSAHANSSD